MCGHTIHGHTYAHALGLCTGYTEEVGHSTFMVTDFKCAFRETVTYLLCTVQKWCLVSITHTKVANIIIIIIPARCVVRPF